jgi:hypothetical protein
MRLVAALLLVGCHASARPSPPIAPQPAGPEPAAPVAAPISAPQPVALAYAADTPTHRELAWIVDLLGTRKGVADRDELAQHWDRSMLGVMPLRQITEGLGEWGAKTESLVVERIEIDDPTYLVAHVATPSYRWRLTLSLDPSSAKLVLLKHTIEP